MPRGVQIIVFVVVQSNPGFTDAAQVLAETDLTRAMKYCEKRPALLRAKRLEVQVWLQNEGWTGTWLYDWRAKSWGQE